MAPTINDSLGARGPEAGLLKAALDTISHNQTITFEPYVRLVLPLDGYVFWVKATEVDESALLNIMGLNKDQLNISGVTAGIPNFTVQGSMHYAVDLRQEETASLAISHVAFASQSAIQQFQAIGPNMIFIGTFRGIRFAFSSKGMFYEQMQLWHYEGDAIYANMESQIVDDPSVFDGTNKIIVSNSLPAWLSLRYYAPPYPVEVPMPRVDIYPSFLVTQNIRPPYVVVHIGPEDTDVDQDIPYLNSLTDSTQLARDNVRVTLYGFDDDMAQDWLQAVIGYMRDARVMGLCNTPNLRDDKSTQRELFVIAMKKRIDFQVSYNQTRVRNVVRALIKTVVPKVIPSSLL